MIWKIMNFLEYIYEDQGPHKTWLPEYRWKAKTRDYLWDSMENLPKLISRK